MGAADTAFLKASGGVGGWGVPDRRVGRACEGGVPEAGGRVLAGWDVRRRILVEGEAWELLLLRLQHLGAGHSPRVDRRDGPLRSYAAVHLPHVRVDCRILVDKERGFACRWD